MAGKTLTQEMIDDLVSKLQYYKYQVAWGETVLGPLNSPPTVEPDVEYKDTVLYETGADPQAQIISKFNANISLEVNDVKTALGLLSTFKKGDNLLDSTTAKALIFTPLTADSAAEVLTFPNTYLQPEPAFNPAEGDDPNYVPLNFLAKPEVESGKLFTFA